MNLNAKQLEWVSTIETQGYRTALFIKAGLGKTATIIAAINKRPDLVWYIFCRRKDMVTWHNEKEKWPITSTWTILSMDSIPITRPTKPYGIVIDESYHVKGNRSQRYRNMRGWCDKANAVLIANGNPVVTSVLDLWAQMRLVIGPLHPTSGSIRACYFSRDLEGFGFHEHPNAVIKYRSRPDVMAHSIFYSPPSKRIITMDTINFALTTTQHRAYNKAKKQFITELNGERHPIKFVMEQAIRLHQICGGCLPFVDHRGKSYLEYFPTTKLSWLQSFLKIESRPVVIWCAYRHEVLRIASMFSMPHLMGGTDILSSKSPHRIVATLDMGTSTNRFSQFPISIYYSQNYKYFLRAQSMARTDREDSKHKECFYYYLNCSGTIEEYIHQRVQEKGMTEAKLFNEESLRKYLTANL